MPPLECGIIIDGIPEGAISRKVGLIWGIPDEKLWFDENTLTADSEEVKYHIRLLAQAGFITSDGIRQGFEGIKELTWAGHDYLDGLRNG